MLCRAVLWCNDCMMCCIALQRAVWSCAGLCGIVVSCDGSSCVVLSVLSCCNVL